MTFECKLQQSIIDTLQYMNEVKLVNQLSLLVASSDLPFCRDFSVRLG